MRDHRDDVDELKDTKKALENMSDEEKKKWQKLNSEKKETRQREAKENALTDAESTAEHHNP